MQQRLKVLHIVVAGQIGGAERLLVELAMRPELSGADHAVAAMTPNRALVDFFRRSGAAVHDRGPVQENPAAYLWRSYGPGDIAWLCNIVAEARADILHCHTYGSHVLAARAHLRTGLPLLRTEHGVRHYRDLSCGLNRHWALANTTKIAAVSGFVAGRVADIAPAAKDKIVVVPNGIDASHFFLQPPREEGPLRLVATARLEPVKRLEIAIAALAKVAGVVLDIVGDGAERGRLQALAHREGVAERVRFVGRQDDVRPFVAASDAAINVSREEALSLSLLEAAAMGRPAIAICQGGVPEAVVDGRTGWLTGDDSVAAFAALLAEVAKDRGEIARRGVAARAYVETNFSITRMCQAYGAVYRGLVSGDDHG
jgi:glycosyltransferase involved in cell wall biosynthesis